MNHKIVQKFMDINKNNEPSFDSIVIIEKINDYSFFGYDKSFNLCFIMKTIKSFPQSVKTEKLELELNHDYKFTDSNNIFTCNIIKISNIDTKNLSTFVKLCMLFIDEKISSPSSDEVFSLFSSLKDLFKNSPKKEKLFLIGLFGELCLIKYFYDKYNVNLVNFYHTSLTEKYDFNINKYLKIEAKTTTRTERVHHFRHDQIFSKLKTIIIASILLNYEENGTSIMDLFDKITDLFDLSFSTRLSLQRDIELISNDFRSITFDFENCMNNIRLFFNKDLETISNNYPDYITEISYSVNMNNIKSISDTDLFMFIEQLQMENKNNIK